MKKVIFVMMALISAMCVNAQTVESSRFIDNWSVGLKGGAVTPLNHASFWGDMRGIVGLELKKEVTPILGLGIEGEWTINTSGWARNMHSANVFDHQLVGSFMTVNLMNAIAGYKGTRRLCEVEIAGGLGWLHAYNTKSADINSWYTKFGTNVNFNLGNSKEWAVSFKPSVVFNMYDGLYTNFNSNRAYLELQVGVVYRFKNRNNTHSFKLCDKVATQSEIDALNNTINTLKSQKPDTVVQYVEKVVVKEKNVEVDNVKLNNAIGFKINSSDITETSYASLSNIAQWLNDNESVNVVIKGYADKNTGTAEYNKRLSLERANKVKTILIDTFGIKEDRLTVLGIGDSEQVYPTNDWNRVVVFTTK